MPSIVTAIMLNMMTTFQSAIRTPMRALQIAMYGAVLAPGEVIIVRSVVSVIEPIVRAIMAIGQSVVLAGMPVTAVIVVRRRRRRHAEQGRRADQCGVTARKCALRTPGPNEQRTTRIGG